MNTLRSYGISDALTRRLAARVLRQARKDVRRRVGYINANPLALPVILSSPETITSTWCEAWGLALVSETQCRLNRYGVDESHALHPHYGQVEQAIARLIACRRSAIAA